MDRYSAEMSAECETEAWFGAVVLRFMAQGWLKDWSPPKNSRQSKQLPTISESNRQPLWQGCRERGLRLSRIGPAQ